MKGGYRCPKINDIRKNHRSRKYRNTARSKFLAALLALILLGGCVPLQTAETEAEVALPGGKMFRYKSGKDVQGLKLEIWEIDPDSGKTIKKWFLQVDKSGTPEAAYAAMIQQQQSVTDLVKILVPLIEKLTAAAPGVP